jgi:hypothetical protein
VGDPYRESNYSPPPCSQCTDFRYIITVNLIVVIIIRLIFCTLDYSQSLQNTVHGNNYIIRFTSDVRDNEMALKERNNPDVQYETYGMNVMND